MRSVRLPHQGVLTPPQPNYPRAQVPVSLGGASFQMRLEIWSHSFDRSLERFASLNSS